MRIWENPILFLEGKLEVCPDCCPDCKLRECADPSICPQPEEKNILRSIVASGKAHIY